MNKTTNSSLLHSKKKNILSAHDILVSPENYKELKENVESLDKKNNVKKILLFLKNHNLTPSSYIDRYPPPNGFKSREYLEKYPRYVPLELYLTIWNVPNFLRVFKM